MLFNKFNKKETLYLRMIVGDQMRKMEMLIGSLPEEKTDEHKDAIENITEMYRFLQNLQSKI